MLIRKAFKFELMPNGEQVRKMKQFAGCSRFVFNKALAYQNEQYQQDNSFKHAVEDVINHPVVKKLKENCLQVCVFEI